MCHIGGVETVPLMSQILDLLRPADSRYAGRVATYDIKDSGVGYLFAFADSQAATTFGGLIEAFGRSGAVATCCSAEIIDAVASGRFLAAYNVLGSYALARAAVDPRIGDRPGPGLDPATVPAGLPGGPGRSRGLQPVGEAEPMLVKPPLAAGALAEHLGQRLG